MQWYLAVLKKYTVFEGRAQRAEYWYFSLFSLLVSVGLILIDTQLGGYDPKTGYGILYALYSLAIVLPSLAVTVRRLHDTDHSGWWFFIMLVPILGAFVFLYFMIKDGSAGDNRFGPNPKTRPGNNTDLRRPELGVH